MRKLFTLLIALSLAGCAYAQQQKENEAKWAPILEQAKKVKILKEEPEGCEFIKPINAVSDLALSPSYETAYKNFQVETVLQKANTAVIDSVQNPSGENRNYSISGRAYNCPE